MSGSDMADAETFGSYSFDGAYVHRLFLPLVSTAENPMDDPPTPSWGSLARAAGVDLDAGTECGLILGWGRGDGQVPPLRPSDGSAPLRTLKRIQQLLLHVAPARDQRWQLRPFELMTGTENVDNRQFSTDLVRFLVCGNRVRCLAR